MTNTMAGVLSLVVARLAPRCSGYVGYFFMLAYFLGNSISVAPDFVVHFRRYLGGFGMMTLIVVFVDHSWILSSLWNSGLSFMFWFRQSDIIADDKLDW